MMSQRKPRGKAGDGKTICLLIADDVESLRPNPCFGQTLEPESIGKSLQ